MSRTPDCPPRCNGRCDDCSKVKDAAQTERSVLDLIHATWGGQMAGNGPRYVVAEHVHNGAGFGYTGSLDAVVLDTWPSKGLLFHGLEVKVSKADMRRELQDTRKFAAFAPYLDHFSVVAPQGVAQLSLLPPNWGLYVPVGEGAQMRLRAARKPLMLHDGTSAETFDRSFAAAFCRALVTRSASVSLLDKARAEGRKLAEDLAEINHGALRKAVEDFEEVSGVQIKKYGGERIGEAVKFVMEGGLRVSGQRISALRTSGQQLIEIAARLESHKEPSSAVKAAREQAGIEGGSS